MCNQVLGLERGAFLNITPAIENFLDDHRQAHQGLGTFGTQQLRTGVTGAVAPAAYIELVEGIRPRFQLKFFVDTIVAFDFAEFATPCMLGAIYVAERRIFDSEYAHDIVDPLRKHHRKRAAGRVAVNIHRIFIAWEVFLDGGDSTLLESRGPAGHTIVEDGIWFGFCQRANSISRPLAVVLNDRILIAGNVFSAQPDRRANLQRICVIIMGGHIASRPVASRRMKGMSPRVAHADNLVAEFSCK